MIRGTKRVFEKWPSVKANINASIHNRFDIEVVDAKTGEIKQKAQAFNVICDQMWSRLLSVNAWNSSLQIGTGNGTPSASDTQLFSFLVSKSTTIISHANKPGIFSVTKRAQLLETENVGATLTEVGISYSSSSTSLCTHAMLEDMNGNPISILKTDTDIINIYSTVFVHYNPEGYDGINIVTADNSATDTYSYVYGLLFYVALGVTTGAYGYGCGIYPQRYAACTGLLPNYGSGTDSVGFVWNASVATTFDVEAKKLICTASRIAAATGNENKNSYYIIAFSDRDCRYGAFMMPTSALFPGGIKIKDEVVGTGDGTAIDFTTAFPGVSNCTVYVDGIATDAVVDEHTPFMVSTREDARLLEVWQQAEDGTFHTGKTTIASTISVPAGGELILRNPFYRTMGIQQFYDTFSNLQLYASQDRSDWVQLTGTGKNPYTVPEAYRRYEWFKVVAPDSASSLWLFHRSYGVVMDRESNANIHFTTPPASGAIITADYTTDVIAKDENHVFDFSFEITLGEYNHNA